MAAEGSSVFSGSNWGNWAESLYGGGNWGTAASNWGNTLMGASGSGGGIGGMQYFAKAAQGVGEMATTYMISDAAESAYAFQGEMATRNAAMSASAAKFDAGMQSRSFRRQAKAISEQAGETQLAGRDAATLRYNALGGEIAAQRVAAAGSGIDVTSDIARRSAATSRAAAERDVGKASRNAWMRADALASNASDALLNSAYATVQGDYAAKSIGLAGQAQKNLADYQSEMNDIRTNFSLMKQGFNVGVNVGKGIADIWSGGWVSLADSASGGKLGTINSGGGGKRKRMVVEVVGNA